MTPERLKEIRAMLANVPDNYDEITSTPEKPCPCCHHKVIFHEYIRDIRDLLAEIERLKQEQ